MAPDDGGIEEAPASCGAVFAFELRGRAGGHAFLDMRDQFPARMEAPGRGPDERRRDGPMVDDRSGARAPAGAAGATVPGLDFLDPWGNRVAVLECRGLQLTKAP